ncbi:MAG: hypothetical protein ACM3NR_02970 [Methanosarcina sp.]
MNFLRTILIAGFSLALVTNATSQDKLSQSLASIKGKIQDVQIDKTTFKQSIDILDEIKGKVEFSSSVIDEKGKTTKDVYEFYISDIDPNTILRKTSGKKLFISLTVNNNQKFIKHSRDDKPESYTSNMEILFSDADGAQELANTFKTAISLVKPVQKAWNTNTDALNWLRSNIVKITSGSDTFEQSFSFGEPKKYLVSFGMKKTDQKGLSTEEKYEFNLLDINKKELGIKITGSQLAVSVETNEKNRYIKYYKNNEQQNFDNSFQIISDDLDNARNIISALTTAIEKSQQVFPDLGNLSKSIDYITKNTIDVTSENKKRGQKINFTTGKGTKSILTCSEADSKGNVVEERYEFYLNDIDANSLNFKINGKKIIIPVISKNNTRFIKYFKDNTVQDFQNEIGILTSDIETSRELVEAFKTAVKNSQAQPPVWKNINEAIAYLAASVTGETIGSEIYKLNFSAIASEPVNLRYVENKTDSKAANVEQTLEFYPYMLDPGVVKITAQGKYLKVTALVKNKKSYVKVYNNGLQQSFDNELSIIAFDARQAQDLAEALKYIINNAVEKNLSWKDKQSAMKYIIENTGAIKNDKKEINQKINLVNNDPCKISCTISTTDDKGKTVDEIYEFALSDINKQVAGFSVSGRNVSISLTCKNKGKLVKVYKNGEQQSWGTSVEISATDIESAKNLVEAFKAAVSMCENQ